MQTSRPLRVCADCGFKDSSPVPPTMCPQCHNNPDSPLAPKNALQKMNRHARRAHEAQKRALQRRVQKQIAAEGGKYEAA
jgi:hypothetical protein